jgi:hypothetical protein
MIGMLVNYANSNARSIYPIGALVKSIQRVTLLKPDLLPVLASSKALKGGRCAFLLGQGAQRTFDKVFFLFHFNVGPTTYIFSYSISM